MNTEDPGDILGMLDSIEEAIQATQWVSPEGEAEPENRHAPATVRPPEAQLGVAGLADEPPPPGEAPQAPGHGALDEAIEAMQAAVDEAHAALKEPEGAAAEGPITPLRVPRSLRPAPHSPAPSLPLTLRSYPDPPPRRLGVAPARGTTAAVLGRFRWSGP